MGKTAIVYRVEHRRTGEGPWSHRDMSWWGFNSHEGAPSPGRLPPPAYDPGLEDYPHPGEYCATASVRKLKRWFDDPHLRDLERGGFVVRRYKVPAHKVRRGENQVLFPKADAVPLGEYSPTRYVGA